MAQKSDEVLQRKLLEYSSDAFFIEYDVFFSNHIAHGLIALADLGASEVRLDRFAEWYKQRLEVKGGPMSSGTVSVNESTLLDYLGKRENYYGLLDYHKKELRDTYGGDIEKLVGAELPKVLDGIAGSALHGLIELGYGLGARSEQITCQGLAYLCHSFRPVQAFGKVGVSGNLGQGNTDILDVLKTFRDNATLIPEVEAKADKVDLPTSRFQKKMTVLLSDYGEMLVSYASQIKLPPKESSDYWSVVVPQWILKSALYVYAAAEKRNDFFLIHGVTATWSMSKLVPLLETELLQKRAIHTLLCVFTATYVIQGSPELVGFPNDLELVDWDPLITQVFELDLDEHVFKMIQVCKELAAKHPGDNDVQQLCMTAANIAPKFPQKLFMNHLVTTSV